MGSPAICYSAATWLTTAGSWQWGGCGFPSRKQTPDSSTSEFLHLVLSIPLKYEVCPDHPA